LKEHKLIRAQEKFIGALLRSPGSVAVVRVAGLTTSYFPPRLAGAFEFALKGDRDRDQTLRSVLEGGEIARLFRLGIPLSHGLALQLGRQIRVSLVRERSWVRASRAGQPLAQTVRPTGAVPDAVATKISAELTTAPLTAIAAAPPPANAGVVRKRSGAYLNTVVAFLLEVLADGPLLVREIEARAITAGLLEPGKSIGDTKVFRTARSKLGVRTFQRAGLKAGGWVWALPQTTSDAPPAAGLDNNPT
jgi:hypothetical protein